MAESQSPRMRDEFRSRSALLASKSKATNGRRDSSRSLSPDPRPHDHHYRTHERSPSPDPRSRDFESHERYQYGSVSGSKSPPPSQTRSKGRPQSFSPSRAPNSRSPSPLPRSRSRSPARDDVVNPGNTLFVTGLSSRVTERDLKHHISKEGKVVDCNVVTQPHTRVSRGFAFVTMDTVQDADRCMKYLDQSVLDGRKITIEKSRRKRPQTPTPGNYLGFRNPDNFRGGDRHGSRYRDDNFRGGGDRYGNRYRDDNFRGGDRYGSRNREDYYKKDRYSQYGQGSPYRGSRGHYSPHPRS